MPSTSIASLTALACPLYRWDVERERGRWDVNVEGGTREVEGGSRDVNVEGERDRERDRISRSLSSCSLVHLFSCLLVLLSTCSLVILSSCLLVLLSSCSLVFLSSCFLLIPLIPFTPYLLYPTKIFHLFCIFLEKM